jgi:hypothetical protein
MITDVNVYKLAELIKENDGLRSQLSEHERGDKMLLEMLPGHKTIAEGINDLRQKLELRDREILGYQEMQQSNLNTVNALYAKLDAAERAGAQMREALTDVCLFLRKESDSYHDGSTAKAVFIEPADAIVKLLDSSDCGRGFVRASELVEKLSVIKTRCDRTGSPVTAAMINELLQTLRGGTP